MNDTTYLETLLDGIGQATAAAALSPIAATTWNRKTEQKLPLGKLSLSDNLLPGGTATTKADWEEEHKFVRELAARDPRAGKLTAYYLAQAWGSRQATAVAATTTRFDTNRLAAAKASCAATGSPPLLVKGSVTGIQKYIYDNIKAEQLGEAKQVSRRLRGRSFLVAILGELMADFLVRKLGLEQAHVLFVGGGHFNLLLPADRAADLDALIWDVNQGLLRQFQLKLGVVVAYEEIAENRPFGESFQRVDDKLEARKQQRFRGHLSELFFAPKELGRFAAPQKNGELSKEEKRVNLVGRWLPKVKFMLEISGPDHHHIPKAFSKKFLSLEMLEKSLLFLPGARNWEAVRKELEKIDFSAFGTDTEFTLYCLNDTEFLPPPASWKAFAHWPLAYGYRFIGQYAPTYEEDQANDSERREGDLMELGDLAGLAGNEEQVLRYTRIAAMRLDIDDLGSLFQAGLPQHNGLDGLEPTLVLSRELQHFFGGYFNVLAERHQIYIVYSGGDDAFVLGSWLNVLRFAHDFHRTFEKFTGGNPELTVSAGVFLANPSYPITRLADDAGGQEKIAKRYGRTDGPGTETKNAIRVFGHTMSWQRFTELLDFAEQLSAEVSSGSKGLRRSVLQHLLSVIQAAERDTADDFYFYRQLGRLHALLTRRKVNTHQIVEQMLQETADFSRFRDYVLPLHYALYKTRNR